MRGAVLKVFAVVMTALALASSSCPSQPWNSRCDHCCEQAWLACRCTATGEMTGYPVPCCRKGYLCTPCVDYPGCSVFQNCKHCYTAPRNGVTPTNAVPRYCSACYEGWRGSDCRTCGGMVSEHVGLIALEKYPNEADCLWTIEAERNSTIELTFEALDIEFEDNCLYDSLTFYDGAYTPTARAHTLCGNVTLKAFTTKTHVLIIHFRSDKTTTGSGFRVSYRKLDVCVKRPCLNGGACLLTSLNNFVCICPVGYHGSLCERVVKCKLPHRSPYVKITLNSRGIEYGSKIIYGCTMDYFPLGPLKAYCQGNGKWTKNPPICLPTCPKPKSPRHGHIDGGIFTVNSKIVFVCKPGYRLIGDRSQFCGNNRQWTGEPPVCVPKSMCTDPGHPENGRRRLIDAVKTHLSGDPVLTSVLWPHTQVLYSCNHPYQLKGRKVRTCLLTGELTGDQPICVKDSVSRCLPIDIHWDEIRRLSLTLTYQSLDWQIASPANVTFAVGTTVEVTCLAPLMLHGSMTTLECSVNGTWILQSGSSFPECINATSCEILPLSSHIRITYDAQFGRKVDRTLDSEAQEALESGFVPIGTVATFSCINGVLNRNARRVCTENGTWTGPQPECVFGCSDPGVPSHSIRTAWIGPEASEEERMRTGAILRTLPRGSRLFTGTVLLFGCEANFFIQGVRKRVCLSNGQWSTSNNPVCLPRCGEFPKTASYVNGNSTSTIPVTSPWYATIKRIHRFPAKWKIHCGGSYVGDNLILTTAQCVTYASTAVTFQPGDLLVHLGSIWDTRPEQHYKVSEIIIHEKYEPIAVDNNIAVLVLSTTVHLDSNRNTWPVCIPQGRDYKTLRFRGLSFKDYATVSGWNEQHHLEGKRTLVFGENAGWALADGKRPMDFGQIANESNLVFGKLRLSERPDTTAGENKTKAFVRVSFKGSRRVLQTFGLQRVQVVRKRVSDCARAFRRPLTAAKMICALQLGTDYCFERRGNPLVVSRRVKTEFQTKKKRASQNTALVRLTQSDNVLMTQRKRHTSRVWVLAGLASWTDGICAKPNASRLTVFAKIRGFADWIAGIRAELEDRDILLPNE